MSQTVSEFIFFKVKPTVRPEDPENEEGEALLNVFRRATHASGHKSSSWGRAVEDEDTLVWVVDWTDAFGSTDAKQLNPFLNPNNTTPPTALYSTPIPPISTTDTLTKNTITEITILPFASSLPALETRQLHADLINFRTTLVETLPQATGPQSWAMGHVDRPVIQHSKSPSAQAVCHILAVGWESVEDHEKARETEQFRNAIKPIREKLLSPVPGLEMKHVKFLKIA